MLKNRTLLGLISVAAAIVLVFGISPLFNKAFDGKTPVVVLNAPVLQGQQITENMLSVVQMGSYNLPENAITNSESVIGLYAASDLFSGSLLLPEMLTTSVNTTDSMLRNLEEHEIAMSVTINNFASGFSGKLMTGDIIRIVMVDSDRVAHLFDELQYVEVLTTTSGNGGDNIERAPAPDENGEISMPSTITVILHDNLQVLRLAECEHITLHAVFVSRDEEMRDEYVQMQMDLIEQIYENMEEMETEISVMESASFGGDTND